MRREAAFVVMLTLLTLLAGCTAKGADSRIPSSVDAGTPPASASAECSASGPYDAGAFLYTASCSFPTDDADDAGSVTSCQQWSESEDGDWTPFIVSCVEASGAIDTVPCPDAGLIGVCALPPSCTTQAFVFQYGAGDQASARTSCEATPGASFLP